jgi:hypothetical protein
VNALGNKRGLKPMFDFDSSFGKSIIVTFIVILLDMVLIYMEKLPLNTTNFLFLIFIFLVSWIVFSEREIKNLRDILLRYYEKYPDDF